MSKPSIPELTFAEVPLNQGEEPWDMRMFLYRGASAWRKDAVRAAIDAGEFGSPISERLPLVVSLHDQVAAGVAKGHSKRTLENVMTALRAYFRYVDEAGPEEPTIATAANLYIEWMEWCAQRVATHDLKASSQYRIGVTAGAPLALAIGRTDSSLFRAARLERKGRKKAIYRTSDKQNLENTFAMGHALLDICLALPETVIRGRLPILLTFRSGQTYEEWCGYRRRSVDELLQGKVSGRLRVSARFVEERRRWESDVSNRQRSPAINARLDAELLIFIAQTGMNLTQAWKMQMGDFRYESLRDGYGVRRYKNRRLGEVEFHIYSEYREHFDLYLKWRAVVFADTDSDLLFPYINKKGEPASHGKRTFKEIEMRLAAAQVKLVRPQSLRQTRINWMLRRTGDPALTAEMHGHSVEVLHDEYERPHHQRAVAETTRFWHETDPAIASPGPGVCVVATPMMLPESPEEAPKPDCRAPDGCLFCAHQRDLDTLDHVWSLASLRHLKSLEMARDGLWMATPDKHPAHRVMERIAEKLEYYAHSTSERAVWVEEVALRMSEGRHHKRWAGWIAMAELTV
ncbi:hypothetical protein [Rhodanobacter sp. Root179]|uniref:hypothetical protein n=1 Tax=Rhodanobacter sp. Root179 TaxID=1736482 RepID=UPI0012F7A3E7|nr:hypothetical protein [Rhodanobacter sp. Root179]